MAFSDWDSYTDLLDKLADAESNWSAATDFAGFDDKIRQNCQALVPDAGGYAELVTSLDESGDYDDNEALFAHLRIVIFAEAADTATLGEDWTGYWISKDIDDAQIYAESRTAPVADWTAMDDTATAEEPVTDDVDAAGPAEDTPEQLFDEESGRWYRFSDEDQVYEYYHDADDVWERMQGDLWTRYHDGAEQWLPYDGPSETWLDEDVWVAYEQVGAPDDEEEDLDALAERLVAETLADLEEEIEPLSDDERTEAIAEVRRELEKERVR